MLLVYGGGSIKRIGLYDAIKGVLEQNKTENIELSSVEPNPRIESVYLGVELCKRKMVDVILAVGIGYNMS